MIIMQARDTYTHIYTISPDSRAIGADKSQVTIQRFTYRIEVTLSASPAKSLAHI